jgi:hypothetical protein
MAAEQEAKYAFEEAEMQEDMITDLGPSTGAEKQAKRLAAMPVSLRTLFARAYAKNCSPRAAIKAFCIECQGYDRPAVTSCTAYACPLWRFRPFQKLSKTKPD